MQKHSRRKNTPCLKYLCETFADFNTVSNAQTTTLAFHKVMLQQY